MNRMNTAIAKTPLIDMRYLLIGLFMLAAAGLAVVMKPTPVPKQAQPDLEVMLPKQFGDWTIDPNIAPVMPTTGVQQQLKETYDQMVNRTYVNSRGERMMISVAYGSQQTQKLKAHRQEVCYASQGFEIRNFHRDQAVVNGAPIGVYRMFAINKQRYEPVTYWFTVGDKVVGSRFDRLLVQIQYAFTGTIPDGVLVRISNISRDEASAYARHIEFINTLFQSMPSESVKKLVGSAG
jgi:EpsI family protein